MRIKEGAHVHLMGICGTGMAGLAGLLKEKGFRVTGSDQNMYPPMSEYIKALGLTVMVGYSPKNLYPQPDLVIVGNVITRENPEAQELLKRDIPYLSFPEALKEFAFEGKEPIVIAGTHGKTTTTSLVAWILTCSGQDPGYLIGGIPLNLKKNFHLGTGRYFVIEGDEYDTAFFDKRPKFLHYMPKIGLITSIEFDHADIYTDYSHVLKSFKSFVSIIPPDGSLVVNHSCLNELYGQESLTPNISTYGNGHNNHFNLVDSNQSKDFSHFKVEYKDKIYEFSTRLYGNHNLLNLTGGIAIGLILGIDPEVIKKAVFSFHGVRRRQEIVGLVDDVLIIDDFAHHPTAVMETISAVRERFSPNRLIAVFEPRSNSSRRNVFQDRYPHSFLKADVVIIPEPKNMEKIPLDKRFSSKRLVEDLKGLGKEAFYFESSDEILNFLTNYLSPKDLVLFMSNGDFERLPQRVFQNLIMREEGQ